MIGYGHPIDQNINIIYIFGMNAIKQMKATLGMRQLEIAERLGYHPQYISNLARGRMPITPQFVARVEQEFGQAAAALFLPHVGTIMPTKSTSLPAQ